MQNAQGQTVLHLLAERAVREKQERQAGVGAAAAAAAEAAPPEFPAVRMLELLSEHNLLLDTPEYETGNTALHHAAFGGCIELSAYIVSRRLLLRTAGTFHRCIELSVQLVRLGGSVGLPNKDGFTPLDSSYRSLP